MFKYFRNCLVLLTAILIAVSFSCKQTASVIYGTNKSLKEKSYYIKKFQRKNIDTKKVYFIDKTSPKQDSILIFDNLCFEADGIVTVPARPHSSLFHTSI